MSESNPPQKPSSEHLATVLNRIQHLIQESEPPSTKVPDSVQPAIEDEIPVLTEVYEGAPEQLHQVDMQDMPTLQAIVEQAVVEHAPISEEMADYILGQMQPLIQKTVKLAVLEASVNMENMLTEKLQVQVLEAIRERLITNHSSDD